MVVARKMGVDEYGYEERSQAYQRLSRELLLVQRNALVRLGNESATREPSRTRPSTASGATSTSKRRAWIAGGFQLPVRGLRLFGASGEVRPEGVFVPAGGSCPRLVGALEEP